MPSNLIFGYGPKRDPKQKKQTEAAEETDSIPMQPMGEDKKRHDAVRDYLNRFIEDAENRLEKVRFWLEHNPG